MKPSHIFLLILTTAIWGFNFVAIKVGLQNVPPLTFSAMRFLLAFFPVIFFVKRPHIPLPKLAYLALVMFVGQFAFLYTAMTFGLSAGLASLVLQMQVFFTIGFAVLFLGEKPLLFQILGTIVAAAGVAVVGFHTGGDVTWLGLSLALLAAMSWGGGNVVIKTLGKTDMFALVVWLSCFATAPLLLLAVLFEGHAAMIASVVDMSWLTLLSLAYIVYISTYFGFTVWNKMLAQYSAVSVAPFTLLVPAFGMLSASVFLGEAYPLWKFLATCLIVTGLCLNQFGAKLQRRFSRMVGKVA